MIVDVLVNYTASLVPPGKRNSVATKLRDTIAVSLREVSHDEAPVVAWWSPEGHRDQFALRHFDGRLYGPVTLDEDTRHGRKPPAKGAKDPAACRKHGRPDAPGIAGLVTAGTLARLMSEGKAFVQGKHLQAMDFDEKAPTLDEVVHRKVETTNRPHLEATLHGHAAELLMVGGTAYRLVPEPILRVTYDRSGTSLDADFSEGGYKSLALAFRLDRWDEAFATWKDRIVAAGRWEKGYERGRDLPYGYSLATRPEILRPDLLAVDAAALATRHVARHVVEHLGQPNRTGYSNWGHPNLLSHGRGVALAFARIRDALAEGAGTEFLAERLAEFAEETDGIGLLMSLRDEVTSLLDRLSREADRDAMAGMEAPSCA